MQTGGVAVTVGKVLFPSWRLSLLGIALTMAGSVVLIGFWKPYWNVADQDLTLAYQGLLLNDGLPQEYFGHTGYLYDLLLAAWYRLLHAIGLLPVHALSELPAPTDAAAFDRAWQQIIEAGRALSLILGIAFVWIYAILVRRLIGDWRIAIAAGIALAYSGGVAIHIRIMRTELLAAGLLTSALLLVLVAARMAGIRRDAFIALAGLCATLAVVTKVQALLPALAIPVIALAFGETDRVEGKSSRRWSRAALALIVAMAVAYPAAVLLREGMAGVGAYRPIGGGLSGAYQWAIVLWVAGAMAIYAVVWRAAAADTIAAMAALAGGIGLGLLSLHIRYHPGNVIAVANPIEHLFSFAASGASVLTDEPQMLTGTFALSLAKGVVQALAMHSFVFSTSARPTLLLEWFAIAGIVVLWRRGERRLPMQAGLLIVVAWGLDAIFSLRSLQTPYFAFTDPLLILAAALVFAEWREWIGRPWMKNAAVGLLCVYVIWGHLEPGKLALRHRDPQESCAWLPATTPRVSYPFCRASAESRH